MNAKLIQKISTFFGAGQSDSLLKVDTQSQQNNSSRQPGGSSQFGMALEPRIMLDAAITATGSEVQEDMSSQEPTVDSGADKQASEEKLLEAFAPLAAGPAREVILVDPSVSDYQTLLQDLPAGVEVHILSESATLSEISDVLSSYSDLDAVHLISHGGTGSLSLGGETVTESTLQEQQQILTAIGQSLSEDGDILLYGCNVGGDESGQSFIDLFAALTSADVAASDDLTGVGGDWELEVEEGEIEASVAIAQSAQAVYNFNLAAPAINIDASNLSYTENDPATQIDAAATLSDGDGDSDWQTGSSSITVQITTAAEAADELSIADGGDGSNISVSGTTLLSGATVIADLTSSGTITNGVVTNSDSLIITFRNDPAVTNTVVRDVLRSVRYRSTSDDPGTTNRVITVTASANSESATGPNTRTVAITAVNDAPALTGDLAAAIDEGATHTILAADLGYSDDDDVDAGITFTTSSAVNGKIQVNGSDATSFTGTQLTAGQVTFVHDGSETTSASFDVSVEDGDEDSSTPVSSTFNLTITPVNDAPVLTGDLAATINEGATHTILAADLGYTDDDDVDAGITFTTSSAVNGKIQVNGSDATSFTGTQLTAGQVTFVHDGSETTSASFDVSVEDGDEDSSTPVSSTFNLTITPVNDAPVLTGDLAATINEGATHTILAADLGYTDDDDVDAGVTFTTSSTVNGKIQLNGTDVTIFTGTQLTAGQVTFVHDGSETTSASFDVSVEDGDEDSSTPVSSTFNLTITPVNDNTPVAVNDGLYSLNEGALDTGRNIITNDTDVDLDSLTIESVGGTAWASLTDSTHGTYTSALGYKEVSTTNGTIYILQDGTTQYQHDGSETTSDSFTYTVTDGTNTSSSATVGYSITPQNDAPSFSNLGGTVEFTEGGAAVTLDSDVTISDIESDALGFGSGDYENAMLTLARNGGANADDVFAVTPGRVATIMSNSGGTMVLLFRNSSTTAEVNAVLQSITYSNSSDAPPASVQIDYTFNDGDGGATPTATGAVTVNITATNDAYTGAPTITGLETQGETLTAHTNTIVDPDGLGSFSYQWQVSDDSGATWSTLSNPHANPHQFTLTNNESDKLVRVVVSYTDGGGTVESIESVATGVIANVNDAPGFSTNAVLNNVNEDDTDPSGETISSLFSGLFQDVDGDSFAGIAITSDTSATGTHGDWQYSTDSGSTWYDVNTIAVSTTNALILDSSAMLRFVPLAGYTSAVPSLSVRAVDNSSAPTNGFTSGGTRQVDNVSSSTRYASSGTLISISITPVNDAPTLSDTTLAFASSVTEDAAAPVSPDNTVGELVSAFTGGGNDIEGATLGIAVTAVNSQGTLYYSAAGDGSDWAAASSLSASSALLLSSTAKVYFVPDQSQVTNAEVISDAFTFRIWDTTSGASGDTGVDTSANGGTTAFSTSTDTVSQTITAANDAPTAADNTITVAEDGSHTFDASEFGFSDVDTGASLVSIDVVTVPAAGTLTYEDSSNSDAVTTVTDGTTITAAEIATMIYTPVADANGNGYATLTFTVNDGTADSGNYTITFNVTPENDAPTMSGANSMTAVAEDAGVPSGTVGNTVASLIDTAGDADSDSVGMAITSVGSNGTLYYSTDGGASWTAAPSVSESSALLLESTARVYFRPDTNVEGTGITAFSFKAWDGSDGNSSGDTADATTGGGTTAFSTGSAADVTITVNESAINDPATGAPLITGSITQGQTITVDDSAVDDPDGMGAKTYTWQSSATGTDGWQQLQTGTGTTYTLTSSDTGKYIRVIVSFDDLNSSPNSESRTSVNYGPVANINDAPSFTSNVSMTAVNEDTTDPAGASVSSLFGSHFSDPDSDSGFTNTLAGIVITADNSGSNGTWQYSTNSTDWYDFPVVTASTGLLLSSSTLVRYVPAADNTTASSLTVFAVDSTTSESFTIGGNTPETYDTAVAGGQTAFSASSVTLDVSINAANDAPVLTTGTAVSLTAVAEDSGAPSGGSAGILVTTAASGLLNGIATDVDGDSLGIAVTGVSNQGTLYYYDGSTWHEVTATLSDSSALLLNGATTRIYFQPNGNVSGDVTDAFTFRAWDGTSGSSGDTNADTTTNGGATAFSENTRAASITINGSADEPFFTGDATLAAVDEDSSPGTGDTVANLFGSLFSDPDGNTLAGIIITGNTTDTGSEGTWQYKTASGSWTTIPVVSGTSGLALDTSASLRFVPAAGYTGNADPLTVYAVDNSGTRTFSAGSAAFLDADTGGTDISTDSVALNTSVTPVNDAPVLDNTESPALTGVSEDAPEPTDSSFGDAVSTLTVGGSDAEGDTLGIAITDISSKGTLWYSTDGGANWTQAATPSASAALLLDSTALVYFRPNANEKGTISDALTIRMWDGTSGTNTGSADTSVNGDATAFSTATDTVSIEVAAGGNDAPVGLPVITGSQTEGEQLTADTSGIIDPDGAPPYTFSYQWQYSDDDGDTWNNISGAESATYTLGDNDADRQLRVEVSFSDGTTTEVLRSAATGAITNVNDAPVFGAGVTLPAINEDVTDPVGSTISDLFDGYYTDADSDSLAGIVITVNSANATTEGAWQYSTDDGDNWHDVGTVSTTTGLLLDAGSKLRFVPVEHFAGSPTGLTVFAVDSSESTVFTTGTTRQTFDTDSETTAATQAVSKVSHAGVTLGTSINAFNDAPALTVSDATLTGPTEDAAAPTNGFTTNSFLVSAIMTGENDVESTPGIAITGVSQGTLYYTTDGGTTWNAVTTALSTTSALLLEHDDRVYFKPDANVSGTVDNAITFRAWDGSTGTAGDTDADTSTNGGTSAFSANADTVNITIANVNDAPSFTGDATLSAVDEDNKTSAGATVSSLFGGLFSDIDADSLAGIAITADAANGTTEGKWQYSTDSGDNWNDIGTVDTDSALLLDKDTLLRFVPVDDYNGPVGALTAHAVDDSASTTFTVGGARQTFDTTGDDNTSKVSAGGVALNTSVTAVNDAPSLTTGTHSLGTVAEDSGAPTETSDGILVSSLLSDADDDTDTSSTDHLGIVITNVNTSGTLYYSTDGGANWNEAPSLSDASALVLDSDARVYFKPDTNVYGSDLTAFTFRVWDGTVGSNGDTDVNASTVGGTSAFSADSDTVSINVTASTINDLPTGLPTVTGIFREDSTLTASTAAIVDPDGPASPTYSYQWQASSDDGETWHDISGATAQTYTLTDSEVGEMVRVRVSYTDSGSHVEQLYSAASSVDNVNDAPTFGGGGANLTAVLEDALTPEGETVTSLFGELFNDIDSDSMAGIAIADDSTSPNGTWQYSTNSGTDWYDVGTVSTSSALLLNKDAKLRFVPTADFNGDPGDLTVFAVDDSSATVFTNGSTTKYFDTTGDGADSTVSAAGVMLSTSITDVTDVVDDTLTTDEDTAKTINVLTNDSFDSGAVVSAITQGTNGAVTFLANGDITYTPDADFNGSDSFTYTVTSGGVTETATVNVTVNPVADIVNDTITTNEDTPDTINVLTNDHFESTSTVTAVTQGSNGSVTFLANGNVTYTPNDDFNGNDSFTYTVTTAEGDTETATVNVTVNPDTDIAADTDSTSEDTAVDIDVLANDGFEDSNAAVTAVTQGSNGTVAINLDGSVKYTPNDDFNGTDTFQYTVTTVGGVTETASVTVTISPDVDIVADTDSTSEDTAVDIDVLANDGFEDANAAVTSVTQGSNGSVAINLDGTVKYTPNADFNGTDTFQYTVTTVGGVTETASVTVTINPDGDIAADTDSTSEDTAVDIDVLANDDFEDANAAVTSVTQGTNGTVAINLDGTVKYTPNADFNGTDTFQYTVTTVGGVTETASVTVTINPDGDIVADIDSTNEDTAVDIDVLENDDFEDANAAVTSVTQGSNGSVAINLDGTVKYTPNADFNGTDTFQYTVTTVGGVTETASVSVTINPDGDIVADTDSTNEDTAVDIDVLANDNFEDTNAAVTSVTQGTNGTVAINPDGTVKYTPNDDFNGSDSFQYTVTSGGGLTETATVNVTINADGDIVADTGSVLEDQSVDIDVLANDNFEDSAAAVTAVTNGTNGTVTINPNGTVKYTPNADFYGTDTFQYTVTSGGGLTETATATVTIDPVNDVPSFSLVGNQTVQEDSGANSVANFATAISKGPANESSQNLTFTLTTDNDGAFAVGPQIDATTGELTYTLVDHWNGTINVTVELSDNGGTDDGGVDTAATQSFAINVTPVNDAPLFNGDSALSSIDSVTQAPEGSTIQELFGSLFEDHIDTLFNDGAHDFAGIAITGNMADPENEGFWEYSTDGGANWYDVGDVSDTDALLLENTADVKLRFMPVYTYTGEPGHLEVHAVDSSATESWTAGSNRVDHYDTTTDDHRAHVSAAEVELTTSTSGKIHVISHFPDGGNAERAEPESESSATGAATSQPVITEIASEPSEELAPSELLTSHDDDPAETDHHDESVQDMNQRYDTELYTGIEQTGMDSRPADFTSEQHESWTDMVTDWSNRQLSELEEEEEKVRKAPAPAKAPAEPKQSEQKPSSDSKAKDAEAVEPAESEAEQEEVQASNGLSGQLAEEAGEERQSLSKLVEALEALNNESKSSNRR